MHFAASQLCEVRMLIHRLMRNAICLSASIVFPLARVLCQTEFVTISSSWKASSRAASVHIITKMQRWFSEVFHPCLLFSSFEANAVDASACNLVQDLKHTGVWKSQIYYARSFRKRGIANLCCCLRCMTVSMALVLTITAPCSLKVCQPTWSVVAL